MSWRDQTPPHEVRLAQMSPGAAVAPSAPQDGLPVESRVACVVLVLTANASGTHRSRQQQRPTACRLGRPTETELGPGTDDFDRAASSNGSVARC
jgi:hypothetical protein